MASAGAKAAARFFIVFFFITQTYANDACSAGCQGGSSPKDGFIQGNTYVYSLEGAATIQLSGADKQETTVKLTAGATVVALGNCANLLKVTSLQITGNDGAKYQKPRDMEKLIRFTLQDGVLGSNICAEEGDSQRSLNIKRALLSLLQTAVKHNSEVDVFGICPTTFSVNKEGNGILVRKNRDLNFCAHREQGKQDLLTYIYNPKSEIKNSHIMQSDLRVDAVLKNGIVEKVEAKENYLYRPFSVGQAGVKGSVTTKLNLRETNKGTLPSKCVVPKSIIFENPHLVSTEHNVDNLNLALNSATQAVNGHVQDKSAALFAGLVRVMRVSNKDDILNVYKQIKSGSAVKDNNLAKKVFLDALFRTGTGESIEVSIQLVKNKELTPLQQKLVFISLSTVRHASSNSVKAATALLDLPDVSNDVYLGVGALAGAFCREHPCHGPGVQDPGVAALTGKLSSKLGDCKAASKKAEDLIVTVLKGIRNIQHLEDAVIPKLANCAADKHVRQRVRVAALETFAADPCNGKLKSTALDILKDRQQDSEVRIKAYLALLSCPDSKIADEIKTLLDTEPVYQVGSYITSSIRNLKATANPSRDVAKETIGQIKIVNKFPLDARKYSQNYEFSYEVDTLGVGSAVEANVIFSQDSYLPRSANLNLTAEIFGRQINLIELGVRQGNLDRVIEEFFGPHGVIKSHTPQQTYDGIKKTSTSIIEKIEQRLKGSGKTKRDVMKQISAFGDKLKTDAQGYRGNLDIDVFAKLFGTESIFLSLGDDQPASIEALIDRVFDFIDGGIKDAKDFSHELRHHILFLDQELAYPTAFGVPLKLNLEGAATTKLNFGGNFDIKKIFKDPKNARIELKVIPSANIKVSGTLSIDADVVVHGLKVVATLHTSTGTHLVLKTMETGFDIQLGLPVEKQELVTATSEIFFYKREKGHQDVETKVTFDSGNSRKDYRACFDQLSAAIGLTVCGEVSVPWNDLTNNGKGGPITLKPAFPLNGQAKVSFSLEKDQLSGYHIHGGKTNKNGQHQFELTLDAEGGKKDRKVSFLVEVSAVPQLYSVKAVMNSPIKNLEARAALVNNDKEKSISAGAKVDKEEYNAKVGFIQAGPNTYKPVFDYNIPNYAKSVNVEGTVTMGSGQKKITFNNVCLISQHHRGSLNGFISFEKDIVTDLKVTMGENFATLAGKLQRQEDGSGFDATAEFHNDINPNIDFSLKLNRVDKKDLKLIDLSLVHGKDLTSKTNKISFYSCLKGELDPLPKYEYTNKFSFPAQNIDFEAKSEVETGKKFTLDLDGKYENTKVEFEIELKEDTKKGGDFSVKLKTKLNDKGFDTDFKYKADSDVKGNFAGKLEITPGGKYEVSGTVSHKYKPGDVDYGLNGRYKASGKSEDYKIDVGVVSNSALYNSHLKLSVGANDVLDSVVKVVKEPNPSGTLKIIIKDVLDAQGQFKVNPDKKGNGLIVVDLQKVGKKVKVETNFFVSGPQYNVAIDLFPNFGKDNLNKISFATVNKKVEDSFDSKNTLTINGDKTELHFKKDGKEGKLDEGKFSSSLEIVRSNGKSLNVDWQRDFTNKDDDVKRVVSGNVVYVKESGSSPQKLAYNGRFSMNQKTNLRDGEHHLNILREDGKDVDIKFVAKSSPGKEGRTNFDTKFEVKGSLCQDPLVISTNSDLFVDRETMSGYDSKYRVKGTYGQKTSLDVTGSYKVVAPDEGDAKLENEVTLHLVLPFDKAHDIKISSSDVFLIPEAQDKFFSLTSKNAIQINADAYNYDVDLDFSNGQGKVKVSARLPKQEPFLFETSYTNQESEDSLTTKCNSNLNVVYGGAGKQLQITVEGNRHQDKEGQFTIVIVLPDNLKAKKILSSLKFKRPETGSLSTDVNVDIDGKKYAFSSEIDRSKVDSTMVDIKATCPEGKPARFYVLAQKTGENSYKGDSKIENFGDFSLVLNIDAKLSGPEEFDIKVDADSAKLKLNKIHFEAKSEPAGKAKKIQFNAKENGKNVLSGTTTYQSRNEGNKFIMEGSGSVKIKEQQKTTSFQYIRGLVNEPTENGLLIDFNVALGEKNIVIEHKATNKEYKLSTVYCEEKKQCAHIEINTKVDTSVPNRIVTKSDFGFDLRKLGFAPEFGLQSSSELERFKLPIHNLDIHLNQEKSKYHAQVFAKPAKGVYQTAVTLTTPDRVISLETSTSVPDLQSSKSPFPLQHETVFYLNKNNPKSKTSLRLVGDYKRVEGKEVSTNGQLVFVAPSLGKDLVISGKSSYNIASHALNSEVVLDIFKESAQKVVATLNFSPQVVKSDNDVLKTKVSYNLDAIINGKAIGFEAQLGQKFFLSADEVKYNSVASVTVAKNRKAASVQLEATPSKQIFVVQAPGTEVIRIESGNSYTSPNAKGEVTICLLQDKTYKVTGEVSLASPYTVSVAAGILNEPSKVVLSAKAVPLKLVELKAEQVSGKQSKILGHFALSSQPKLYKPELVVKTEQIVELIEKARADLLTLVKKGETIVKKQTEEATTDAKKLQTSVKDAVPNVQGVLNAYKAELEKISTELHSDKALQQLADTIQSIIKSITKVTSEISERLTEVIQQTSTVFTELLARINEIWTDKVLPSITNMADTWSKIATQLFGGVLDVFSHYLVYISEFLEKHSAELKPLLESISKAVEEFAGSIEKLIKKAKEECKEFLQNLGENIGNLPVVQMVKNALQEYKVLESINGALKEVLNQVKHISPTDELRAFFEALEIYLDKKLNEQPVNDAESLRVLFSKLVSAFDSLISYIRESIGVNAPNVVPGGFVNVPVAFTGVPRLPAALLPEFSFLNFLNPETNIDIDEVIKAYWPKSLNPLDLIPPYKLRGLIAGGQHIFTFDSRHLTFPGTCKYVLAQDAVDGNFSIAITLDKGNAKSVLLADKSGNAIEVNEKGVLTLNGQKYGFPVQKSDTVAWKDGKTLVLMTNYGAFIKCSYNLDICYVEVSGFYLGKLRGLLGDGNNEPFDDFRLPNGKISTSESEFGSAYALDAGCAAVKTVDHSDISAHAGHHGHHGHGQKSSGICSTLFGSKSTLRLCDVSVDIKNYRQACQHATASGSDKDACLIARAYTLACQSSGIPVSVPEECATCTVDGNVYKKNQGFEIKTPTKQADIVITVETTKANEKTYKELVVPLVSQFIDELKTKKIDDIKVTLVGISPKLRYPILYDIDTPKLGGAKIDFKDEQRSKKWESPVFTDHEKADKALGQLAKTLQDVVLELGVDNLHLTYWTMGVKFDWRPKAVKTIIMVHSEACQPAIVPLMQDLGSFMASQALKHTGIVTHLITPVEGLSAEGIKNAGSIIGFNSDNVFVLGDKKRGTSNAKFRGNLEYDDDQCVALADKTYGNVYSSSAFKACNANQRKQFITLAAQTLVDSLAGVSIEQECSCETQGIWSGVRCQVKSRKNNKTSSKKK